MATCRTIRAWRCCCTDAVKNATCVAVMSPLARAWYAAQQVEIGPPPEEAVRAAVFVPMLGRFGEAAVEADVVAAGGEPVAQQRPVLEQGLVRHFGGADGVGLGR